jgi:hypothetical protein
MLVPIQQEAKPSTPVDLPYEEGRPPPPGYRLVERPRSGLITSGLIITGVAWGISVTAAAGNDFEDGTGFLVLPVVGPWLTIAARRTENCVDTASGTICEASNSSARAALVLDGLVQTTGAVLFVIGVSSTKKRYLRNDVTLSLQPARIHRDAYGVSMRGTF